VIHQAPGPMVAASPAVELAKRNSKQRIYPLIEAERRAAGAHRSADAAIDEDELVETGKK
jgi:hypothetical protein